MLSSPPLAKTRTTFLRCVAFCFLAAFASLYPQVPGLYGPRGILPAASAIKQVEPFRIPNLWQEGPNKFLERVNEILPLIDDCRCRYTLSLLVERSVPT